MVGQLRSGGGNRHEPGVTISPTSGQYTTDSTTHQQSSGDTIVDETINTHPQTSFQSAEAQHIGNPRNGNSEGSGGKKGFWVQPRLWNTNIA